MHELGSIDSIAQRVVCFELILLVLSALARFYTTSRAFIGKKSKAEASLCPLFSFLSFCYCLALLCNQLSSSGRPIAAVSILMPGSFLCRWPLLDLPAWLLRLLEPAIWLGAGLLMAGVLTAQTTAVKRLRIVSMYLGSALLFVETLFCTAPLRHLLNSQMAQDAAAISHFLVLQILLFCLIAERILSSLLEKHPWIYGKHRYSAKSWREACRVVAVFCLLTFCFCLCVELLFARHGKLLIGAHYYSWFPENWSHGYAAAKYLPTIAPLLGEYSSADGEVFGTHLEWAKRGGVDFFIFDWWPQRPLPRKLIFSNVRRADFGPDFKFSILYEALDLKAEGERLSDGDPANVVYMTPRRIQAMKSHWKHLARHYMAQPNYLQIDRRPVLFVYASRHLTGPVARAVREARRYVREKTGIDLYLIGDEVYFNVMTSSRTKRVFMLPNQVPNWERLSVFDAITAYNPCDFGRSEHAGTPGVSNFIADVAKLYGFYRAVSQKLGIAFIPSVIPGYNDRGVRPKEDHFVVPRYIGKERETLFGRALKEWAVPNLDQENPIIAVTSWNEWNEGTNIEPSAGSKMTCVDSSLNGSYFAQGECLAGDEFLFLDELRDVKSSTNRLRIRR